MATGKDKGDDSGARSDDRQATGVSRRSFLKAGTSAMPAVLTLQSGAALARSSNLISASSGDTTDAIGRTLCLETDSVIAADGKTGNVYDLGEPPYARVAAIVDRDYRLEANNGSSSISEATICQTGGTYHYKDGGWQSKTFKQGMLVSATALSSFTDSVHFYEM